MDIGKALDNNDIDVLDGSQLFDSSPKISGDAEKKHDEVSNKESEASNELNYDFENLNTEYPEDPKMHGLETIATSHKNHPLKQVIGSLNTLVQTRSNLKPTNKQGFINAVYKGKTHKDLNTCLFAYFLSQIDPTRVTKALSNPAWVNAIQEELLQFKLQKVWILVDLPKGKKAICTKWVFRNKKDERGIMIKNKSRKIKEEVYMCQPPGFEDPDHSNKVYKVVKALYGLHQAPRAWLMKDKFQMSFMGELIFFLGIQVKQKEDRIFISQDKYVTKVLRKINFLDVKFANTPVDTEKTLVKDADGTDVDVHLYRSMIRSLVYLTSSRPDIMYAVCVCAKFQVTFKVSHLHAVKRIIRYLKGHPKLGLWYPRDSLFKLAAYINSDYAGASLDKKSTTGGCQFLGNRLISWQCKKQTVVATSTTKVKYVAAARSRGQKSTESEGFKKTINFLNANPIKYALTVNPTIYTSCIKKFWATEKVKTVNGEEEIQALVDKKKVIIIEITIRSDLYLKDAEDEHETTTFNDPLLSANQALEIGSLKRRVKNLEKKAIKKSHKLKRLYKIGSSTSVESSKDAGLGDQDDASKQGRMIKDLDVDKGVALVDETQGRNDQDMFDTSILDNEEVVVEKEWIESFVPMDTKLVKSNEKAIESSSKRAAGTLEQEDPKRQGIEEKNESAKLKRCLEIVLDDNDDVTIEATPLSSNSPTIVDYKIYKEGRKSFFKIIKANGNSQNYLTFGNIFKKFNREDLEVLWSIVKERFQKTKPVDDMDNLLFQTLKIMFEHLNMVYYLLVEKMYPFTRNILHQMWNDVRLQGRIIGIKRLHDDLRVTAAQENNDLRTSYSVLKEKYETGCEKHEKDNDDLKMHYKRLFASIKKDVSQVFTKSIPKVNVLEKIYTGKSSKPVSKKVSQFTTYSLQKYRKNLKKQHSSETFTSPNHVSNKSLKQAWKRKQNISKQFMYSRDEMLSMHKRDDAVLKNVKDARNNRKVYLDYLKHLKESVETLRAIIEEARTARPLDRSLASTCLYTKHSQELLEYVIGTCLKDFNKRDKKQATTPSNRKKQVPSEDKCRTYHPLVFGLRLLKTFDRELLTAQEFLIKFIRTVRFENDHFGAITGYGDYVIGDIVISRVPVILTGTPSFTTIDQDAPSPSHSSSSLELQPPISHQGVAAGSTIIEENPFVTADNDPFVNVFALEPSFEASSSRDISFAESIHVTKPRHHFGK
nr:putative ribonuclease H-like domain-containing protein [Tanacetum cinerariifolium]